MKIVVYAICKNERSFADRWMASMSEADEVCVLDTGSTDGTPQRLEELGAKVSVQVITPWRFDVARNQSLELVPEDADLCVCTDLDEVFQPGWREKVEAAWAPGVDRLLYRYVWNFLPDGREGMVFWYDKIHRRKGCRWVNPVHEVLQFDGGAPQARYVEGVCLEHHADRSKSRGQYLPLLERTVQEGHLIALHTCSHDYKSIYKSPDAYWDDLQKLREKLLPYVPADQEIKWLRFPGGSTNTISHRYGGSDIMKKLKADAESRGFTYVDWNVCAEDSLGGHPSASTIYNNIIREVGDKNTCVVLMHDTNATKNTAAALPDVIRWFKNAGYRFDTVDHLEKKI